MLEHLLPNVHIMLPKSDDCIMSAISIAESEEFTKQGHLESKENKSTPRRDGNQGT